MEYQLMWERKTRNDAQFYLVSADKFHGLGRRPAYEAKAHSRKFSGEALNHCREQVKLHGILGCDHD